MTRLTGTVTALDLEKGIAYISPSDVFVDLSEAKGEGAPAWREGEKVSFEVVSGPKGTPMATNISAARRVAPRGVAI
ncbi:hypothetical protein MFUL124B02_13870 [Myxococcus fulvus 124B02]|nr:hypothetical protein MFUL124B02_13870 [Myxococcus fulvus 124B02]